MDRNMNEVTAFALATTGWRAHYGFFDPEDKSGLRQRKDTVVGWAAVDGAVWPMRVEYVTARGVPVGSSLDPDADALLGVVTAGESWEDLDGADERVRQILRDGARTYEGED